MKRKVLAISPWPSDATSFWRGAGPLSKIRHPNIEITYNELEKVHWCNLAPYDIVFFQRPFNGMHKEILEIAKTLGKKIWLDFDDDLMNVPEHNRCYELYGSEQFKTVDFPAILKTADFISLSTKHLAEKFKGVNVQIIPNAWDDDMFPIEKKENHPPRFLWRGGPTHDEDLELYLDDFRALSKEYPDAEFYFLGTPSHKVKGCFDSKQYAALGAHGIMRFFRILRQFEGAVNLVPLEFSSFNKSKSNIGMIEGVIAGCATVAPDLDEWKVPGVINYDGTSGSFFAAAKEAYEHSHFNYLKSREYVLENLLLKKVNKQRESILLGL